MTVALMAPDLPPAETTPEQLPPFAEAGHSVKSWAALVASPAAVQVAEIFRGLLGLDQKLHAWLESYGESRDPGADAIAAAGVPLPAALQENGTLPRGLAHDLRGMGWTTTTWLDMIRDCIPELTIGERCGEWVEKFLAARPG